MKILVLAPDVPATSNMPGSPRLFSLSKELSQAHELHLATFCQSEERYRWFLKETSNCPIYKTITILPNPPLPSWRNKQKHRLRLASGLETKYLYPEYHLQIRRTVSRLLAQEAIDLAYADGLVMTQYIEAAPTRPAIADIHDSGTLLTYRRMKSEKRFKVKCALGLEMLSVVKWERSLSKLFSLVITNSPVDEAVMKIVSPFARTLTIPNGVDTEFFSPGNDLACPEKLVFTGVMNYGPNEDAAIYFCDAIFPIIQAQFPKAEFWVVGMDPTPKVKDLARRNGVHVTGKVPDIRPYLQSAGVVVCPIRFGAGMKNKLLAALAMRKPVVATRTSIDGLEIRENHDLMVADGSEDFADKILLLLGDNTYAERLSRNGQCCVRQRYSWVTSGKLLNETVCNLLSHTQFM